MPGRVRTLSRDPEPLQQGNVIFAIHQPDSLVRPLLQLDLEVKYEKLKLNNIAVKTFAKFVR